MKGEMNMYECHTKINNFLLRFYSMERSRPPPAILFMFESTDRPTFSLLISGVFSNSLSDILTFRSERVEVVAGTARHPCPSLSALSRTLERETRREDHDALYGHTKHTHRLLQPGEVVRVRNTNANINSNKHHRKSKLV